MLNFQETPSIMRVTQHFWEWFRHRDASKLTNRSEHMDIYRQSADMRVKLRKRGYGLGLAMDLGKDRMDHGRMSGGCREDVGRISELHL